MTEISDNRSLEIGWLDYSRMVGYSEVDFFSKETSGLAVIQAQSVLNRMARVVVSILDRD